MKAPFNSSAVWNMVKIFALPIFVLLLCAMRAFWREASGLEIETFFLISSYVFAGATCVIGLMKGVDSYRDRERYYRLLSILEGSEHRESLDQAAARLLQNYLSERLWDMFVSPVSISAALLIGITYQIHGPPDQLLLGTGIILGIFGISASLTSIYKHQRKAERGRKK